MGQKPAVETQKRRSVHRWLRLAPILLSIGWSAAATPAALAAPATGAQAWDLRIDGRLPSQSQNGGEIVANPHVAFVLVGNWWCSLFGAGVKRPAICAGVSTGPPVEQSAFLSTLNSLVLKDYGSSYDDELSRYYRVTGCGVFGIGCTTTFVGHGLGLRRYSPYGGVIWAGPVTENNASGAAAAKTLSSLARGFGVASQADVADTVFVFLHAPTLLKPSCADNPSGNGRTSPTGFVTASVYLEDQTHSCKDGLGSPTKITAQQFATFATSHELDEAITSPGFTSHGWLILRPNNVGWQVADPCKLRTAQGATSYTSYPYNNYTRDSLGTVVAAYVAVSTHQCTPVVGTGIPPGGGGGPAVPSCSSVSSSTTVGEAVTIQLSCSAPAGQKETYSIVTNPANGTLDQLDGSRGTVRYTPTSGFSGTDSFTYRASDAGGASQPATVNLTIQASPPPYYVYHVYGTCADGGCGLHERSGPGYSNYPVVGTLYDGDEVDIVCQTAGELVTPNSGTPSDVWDKLTNGAYVTDVYVDTPGTGGNFSPPIPQC